MNLADCQAQFQKKYNRENWHALLPQLLPGVELFASAQDYPLTNDRERTIATARRQFGAATLADGKRIAFYEIDVAAKVDLLRNRVALREIVARCIDEVSAHAVLAFFVHPDKSIYRLTYAAKESRLGDDLKIHTEQTATRRYTYVLGPGETRRTAALRLAALSEKRDAATLKDVTDAFSVEKINREFFDTYKAHYQKFCDHLLAGDVPVKVFKLPLRGLSDEARDHALKPVRDFVKKLLGRLVFLHFLQKKGWLGCPAGVTNWKNGDPDFLRQLYVTAPAADQSRFHSRRLVPLFFDTLNRRRKDDLFAITGTRVPYLNGGLFERDFDGVEQIDFPAGLFADVLEFFGQYNFTIDENDPDDHEIGIDPEMLGHIFENLLEDNKDKGAFYTPKAVVQYMCQQSLIHALVGHFSDDPAARVEIEKLIRTKEPIDARQDSWLALHATQLTKILDDLRICDPAIGSGAFPIGLLQEIYWTKLAINSGLDRAKAKRNIIQNSIYGVDIDAGAVEIARLRFWLALIVEEKNPVPLPNLDYKIMQGNSLLESFEGIDLGNLTGKKSHTVQLLGTEQTELGLKAVSTELTVEFAEGKQAEITSLISGYFDQDDPELKSKLHGKIDGLVLGHIEYNLDLHEERIAAALDNARKDLKSKQARARGYEPTKREVSRIAELEAQLAEVDRKRAALAELQEKPERPFFLWHLYFQNVFARGGFDIVVANPPYVRQESIKDQKAALQATPYECYDGIADLLVYFYERSVKLLRPRGVLTFITSNKFYRAGYGEKLRRYLARELTLHRLIDFGDAPVFEAIAYASILEGTKAVPPNDSAALAYTWEQQMPLDSIESIITTRGQAIQQNELKPEGWRLESPAMLRLLEKLRRSGKTLREFVGSRVYRGITTGFNNAFVVDRATRNQLVHEHRSSSSVLKPYLRGRDVNRWLAESQDQWIIFTRRGIDIEKFPAIQKHLRQFKKELSPGTPGGRKPGSYEWFEIQDNIAYWEEFEKTKIISTKISIRPTFAIDTDKSYLGNTSYFFSATDSGEFLLGLLNSSLFFAYAKKVFVEKQGGWFEVQPDGLEAFPVPATSQAQQAELGSLVERVIAAKRADNESVVQSLEREIDALVFRLYDLTPEEIALVQSATTAAQSAGAPSSASHLQQELKAVSPYFITADRTTIYDRVLAELKKSSPYFTTAAITRRAQELDPEINLDSLAVYLSGATANGLVQDAGRGWYSRLSEPVKLDTKPVEPVVRLLKKKFPLLEDFHCWSTAQVNPWMHHLIAKGVTFVNTDADTMEAVWECLRDAGYDAHLNPTGKAKEQFAVRDKTVVIRRRVFGAPVEGHFSRIETVLVDLLLESERLRLMDKSEFQKMAEAAVQSGRISVPELMNYATNRKQNWQDIFSLDAVKLRHLFEKGDVG
jgi:TaqI-like C-terminal specificity domain/Eco57I restriction-modification methylase